MSYLGTSERAWIWFATLTLPWICLTADIDPAARHTGTRDGCPSSRHVGETTPRVPTQVTILVPRDSGGAGDPTRCTEGRVTATLPVVAVVSGSRGKLARGCSH